MNTLNSKQLCEIQGGSSSLLGAILIGAIIFVSAIYGFFSPYKCGRD